MGPIVKVMPAPLDSTTAKFLAAHTAQAEWICRCRECQTYNAFTSDVSPCVIKVMLRPLCNLDTADLAAGLLALSPRSRFLRFFTGRDTFSPEQLDSLCDSGDKKLGWMLAVHCGGCGWVAIGVGRFAAEKANAARAEVAYTIMDRWQGLGLVYLLFSMVANSAFERGVTTQTGVFLSVNKRIVKLVEALVQSGHAGVRTEDEHDGTTSLEVALPFDRSIRFLNLSPEDAKIVAEAAVGRAGT
jgi:hypothetical protein